MKVPLYKRTIINTILVFNNLKKLVTYVLGGMKLWKQLSLFGALPCVVVMSVYNFMHMAQEAEHPHERPEFIPYDHLRLRTKVSPNLQ